MRGAGGAAAVRALSLAYVLAGSSVLGSSLPTVTQDASSEAGEPVSAASDCGSGSGSYSYSTERIRTVSMLSALAIIALSVLFESGKHGLEHHVPDSFNTLLQALFGELAVLGFIGLVLFVVEQVGWLASLSGVVFDGDTHELEHLIHIAHMVIFFIMVLFLFTLVTLAGIGSFMRWRWALWEDKLLDEWEVNKTLRKRSTDLRPQIVQPWWWGSATRDLFLVVRQSHLRSATGVSHELLEAGDPTDVPRGVDRDKGTLAFGGTAQRLGELSRMYAPCDFFARGHRFLSVEHWYQCQKFRPKGARVSQHYENIRKQPTPELARQLGCCTAKEWNGLSCAGRKADPKFREPEHRIRVMLQGLQAKFMQHRHCQEMLLSTGNRYLLCTDEPESGGAAFWGVGSEQVESPLRRDSMVRRGREPQHWNVLGKLMMSIRERLHEEAAARGRLDESFPFGEYMGQCMGTVLGELVHLPVTVWLLVAVSVSLWWLVAWRTTLDSQVAVWVSLGVVRTLGTWALVVQLRLVTKKVMKSHEGGELEHHKRLFPFRSPNLTLTALRFLVITNAAHFAFFISVYSPHVLDEDAYSAGPRAIMFFLEVALPILSIVAIIPSAVIEFVLASSIGAMRNQGAVRKVQTQSRVRMLLLAVRVVHTVQSMVRGGQERRGSFKGSADGSPPRTPTVSPHSTHFPKGLPALPMGLMSEVPEVVRAVRAAGAGSPDLDGWSLEHVQRPHGVPADLRMAGVLSPWAPVRAAAAGVPLPPQGSSKYAWAYACVDVDEWASDQFAEASRTDPLTAFLLHGGFVFVGPAGKVVSAAAALGDSSGAACGLTFDNPQPWRTEYTPHLQHARRWMRISMQHQAKGCTHFCYILPDEQIESPGAAHWEPSAQGGFAFLYTDPDRECSGRDVFFGANCFREPACCDFGDAQLQFVNDEDGDENDPAVEDANFVVAHVGAPPGWARDRHLWRGIFDMFDMDSDGILTPDEIVNRVQAVREVLSRVEAAGIKRELQLLDANGDGELSFYEFYDFIRVQTVTSEDVDGMFDILRKEEEAISVEQLAMAGRGLSKGLRHAVTADDVTTALFACDENNDGSIDRDEFHTLCCKLGIGPSSGRRRPATSSSGLEDADAARRSPRFDVPMVASVQLDSRLSEPASPVPPPPHLLQQLERPTARQRGRKKGIAPPPPPPGVSPLVPPASESSKPGQTPALTVAPTSTPGPVSGQGQGSAPGSPVAIDFTSDYPDLPHQAPRAPSPPSALGTPAATAGGAAAATAARAEELRAEAAARSEDKSWSGLAYFSQRSRSAQEQAAAGTAETAAAGSAGAGAEAVVTLGGKRVGSGVLSPDQRSLPAPSPRAAGRLGPPPRAPKSVPVSASHAAAMSPPPAAPSPPPPSAPSPAQAVLSPMAVAALSSPAAAQSPRTTPTLQPPVASPRRRRR
eukprot:TRINITY_DN3607_c1_g1_i1.p1 TRINITY_DN3607_c1_g1~~TRINITY_DN3607_c1_g1_i1.p1  ORF type:complete len:1432 (+),score=350.78 TRINITY_DN3607_c1_g1_i1:103-4398(+)